MSKRLTSRKDENAFRQLRQINGLADFSSNDYLGFAQSLELKNRIKAELDNQEHHWLGATGSRLLTGNSAYAEQLEKEIAGHHHAANGLIFNSGYAANTALFSCLPQKNDTIICDELIHASVIDGARLSFAKRLKFRHNNMEDLEKKIRQSTGICYVAVESIYSMDGDLADLRTIAALCQTYNAQLIVDEAHAIGVLGTGLTDVLQLQDLVFARIITFGKALGLHGAIIIGTNLLREYLINFARPFIYSTALPPANLMALRISYQFLLEQPDLPFLLAEKSLLFIQNMPAREILHSTQNTSAIQCVFTNGNIQAQKWSHHLSKQGFDVRAILSPTVPKGKERLRICLHLHNTDEQIMALCTEMYHLNALNL